MKTMIAAIFAVSLLATGCGPVGSGDDATAGETPAGGSMGMCAPGVTDCVDMVVEDGGDAAGTRLTDDELRAEAKSLLGTPEDQLPDDVRVGRRGGEQLMLTEDYVIGRFTVELDDRDGTWVVTVVTVEMEGGPETFSA